MGYAPPEELARVLKLRSWNEAQGTALQRVIDTSSFEVDSECFGSASFGSLAFSEPYPPLVIEVTLERSVEHWQQQEAAFGIVGLGEAVPTVIAKDPWERHAYKLAPLKGSWGLA